MIHGHLTDGILYVDNSLLRAVATCDTQAVLRYANDLVAAEGESKYLKAGHAVHKAMEAWFMGASHPAALAVFNAEYQRWANENVPDDDRLSASNVLRVLQHWMMNHRLDQLPFEVLTDHIEQSFEVPLTDDGRIRFTFKPDVPLVRNRSDGGLYIVDHKTTGSITKEWCQKWYLDSMVAGYTWGMSQVIGEPIVGVYINAIQLSKVPNSSRRCKEHGVPYIECGDLHIKYELVGPIQPTPESVAQWLEAARQLAFRYRETLLKWRLNEIHLVGQQGRFNGSCGYCQYKDFCGTGRTVENVEFMFKREPWEPFKEVEV